MDPANAHSFGIALMGLSLGAAILVWIVAFLIAAFFLYLGAKMVGIHNATVGKSFIAIVGGGILAVITAAVLFFLPGINVIVALIVYIWVVKAVFDTGWLRAFVALLLAGIIEVVVYGAAVLLVRGLV